MGEPGHGQHPDQEDWTTLRAELQASARQELRDLPRAILDGLIEAAIVLLWFALWIVAGGWVGWLAVGDSGILLGGLAGLLIATLGIVIFFIVTFFVGGVFGVRGLLRRRRERQKRQP